MTDKEKKFTNSWKKAIKLGRLKYALINVVFLVFLPMYFQVCLIITSLKRIQFLNLKEL